MNERVKELLIEARKKHMGDSWTYNLNDEEVASKLAELIVIDCIELCNPKAIVVRNDLTDYEKGVEEGFKQARKHISVFFGIKYDLN